MYYDKYSDNQYYARIGDPLPTKAPGTVTSTSVPYLPPLPTNSPLVPNPTATVKWWEKIVQILPKSWKTSDGKINWSVVSDHAKTGAKTAIDLLKARKQANNGYNSGGINPPAQGGGQTQGGNTAPGKDNTMMYALIAAGVIYAVTNKN